jgi:hypothetical protein
MKAPRRGTSGKRASIPCISSARVRPFAKDTRRSQEEINSPAIGRGATGNTSGSGRNRYLRELPLAPSVQHTNKI